MSSRASPKRAMKGRAEGWSPKLKPWPIGEDILRADIGQPIVQITSKISAELLVLWIKFLRCLLSCDRKIV